MLCAAQDDLVHHAQGCIFVTSKLCASQLWQRIFDYVGECGERGPRAIFGVYLVQPLAEFFGVLINQLRDRDLGASLAPVDPSAWVARLALNKWHCLQS